MKNRLFIVGCGGHGRVVADIAIKSQKYDEIFFLDDNPEFQSWQGIYVKGNCQFSEFQNADELIVAVGNNQIREELQEFYKIQGIKIATLIHPDVVIGMDVSIGDGSVVVAGAIINSGAKIGKGAIINTAASIDHDNYIGDFSHISIGVHLAGSVIVGKHVWIGAGATVSNNIKICNNVVVGAGTIIIRDIDESGTYIGVPARKLKRES